MRIFEANISLQVCMFLKEFLNNISSFEIANKKMFDDFGLISVFESRDDFQELKSPCLLLPQILLKSLIE